LLSSLLALAVAAGAPPAKIDKSSPLRGTLSGIVTADDYPSDALDLNQQGSVGVFVRVDAKGAVSDCIITASSGSPALDTQTCRLVWLRAKFTPARDRSGAAVPSTYQQHINWGIADDGGASSEPWSVRWIISGWNKTGKGLVSCRLVFEPQPAKGASGDGKASGCPPYVAGIPALMRGDLNRQADLVIEQRLSIGTIPSLALATGDQLAGKELARLGVDAEGKVSSCRTVETAGLLPPQLPRPCSIIPRRYAQRTNSSGSPAPFTAYFLAGVYAHQSK
jgi:TonB family protein